MPRPIPYKELKEIYRIASDSGLSRRDKLKAVIAVLVSSGYLILPIDIIPDALPLIGTADDLTLWLIIAGAGYKTWQENSKMKKENDLLKYKLQHPYEPLPEE